MNNILDRAQVSERRLSSTQFLIYAILSWATPCRWPRRCTKGFEGVANLEVLHYFYSLRFLRNLFSVERGLLRVVVVENFILFIFQNLFENFGLYLTLEISSMLCAFRRAWFFGSFLLHKVIDFLYWALVYKASIVYSNYIFSFNIKNMIFINTLIYDYGCLIPISAHLPLWTQLPAHVPLVIRCGYIKGVFINFSLSLSSPLGV